MITCRPATEADFPAIHRINRLCATTSCAGVYPADVIQSWAGPFLDWYYREQNAAHQQEGVTLCAENQGEVVGVIRSLGTEIYMLFIDPAWQNRGIGKILLQALDRAVADKGLPPVSEVSSTPNAIAFYEQSGFRKTGEKSRVALPGGLTLELEKMQRGSFRSK
ncbi:MAG: GNAT family N-acetyltransferase [Pseudomonadota bacterium]|nr:GNAT family N-acetyltransferase [Pseudomonadota bacterium]